MKLTKLKSGIALLSFFVYKSYSNAQVYPSSQQLTYQLMPSIPKPDYLVPTTDNTFSSTVIRITDDAYFDSINMYMRPYHHYAKNQPWNSDGSLVCLDGYYAAILDGTNFNFIQTINTTGGPYTWSNTLPNIIYGTNGSNSLVKVDVNTNVQSIVRTFNQFTFVSFGEYEGNLSNDDHYIALQCENGLDKYIICYDLINDTIVSQMPVPIWPNNCTMSQSGNYVLVQWGVDGTNNYEGIWAYNRSNMTPVRNLTSSGGGHYDFGYDTDGNEVCVGSDVDNSSSGIYMIRIDSGQRTYLLSDAQMSWYMHISCRNLDRPGWAYLTEFADPFTQPLKPNYQKIFAVKLDPNASNNAETQTFAFVHHSSFVDYDWAPFGVPNRDGSKVMWRSDWMAGSAGPVESYVAFMPQILNTEELTSNDYEDLSLYPNPSTNMVTLNIGSWKDFDGIIINSLGQAVLEFKNQTTIDISFIENGFYYFVVEYDQRSKVVKFIKN